ncbi:hypothetical protein MUK42_36312 [Musa troglodytarum]|uniref:Uncharacterized protein n=1 Tax=Musa troglodytarum TaxID=320322 RepID=A0A9E7JDL6_9LILI|nr:hypothetical protein MUK42_36312 [Musa troglodytarum]
MIWTHMEMNGQTHGFQKERRVMPARNLTALPEDFVSEKWMESRSESTFWSKVSVRSLKHQQICPQLCEQSKLSEVYF